MDADAFEAFREAGGAFDEETARKLEAHIPLPVAQRKQMCSIGVFEVVCRRRRDCGRGLAA